MPNLLIDFDPASKSCVVFLHTNKQSPDQWVTVTTATTPEQLWAAVQAASREHSHLNIEKARRRLQQAQEEVAKGKQDLEESIRLFCAEKSDLLFVKPEDLGKAAKKVLQGKPAPVGIDLDDLGL